MQTFFYNVSYSVSTHSRTKAAALGSFGALYGCFVSTHSRTKAAALFQ